MVRPSLFLPLQVPRLDPDPISIISISPSSGLDEPLAHHIAHLYIRDPLVIFTETLDQDNSLSTDHFEVSLPFST